METCLKKLSKKIVCRDDLIRLLFHLIGNDLEALPPSIFIYGHMSTGKSLVVESLLQHLEFGHSVINCIEHPTTKHIFEFILSDLTGNESIKCDNLMEFVDHLKQLKDLGPILIILDKCERLREMDSNILPGFLRLKELTGLNISVILISNIIWEKFLTKSGLPEPIKVPFNQYSREEMVEILQLSRPKLISKSFYESYLNLFLSVFFRFCRDILELDYMAKTNFIKYVEPIEKDLCSEKDLKTLWRNISGVLKANLEVIYLRVSSDDFNKFESSTQLALGFELPFYAKFLLISAYLASYNPAKEDKRLFMKESSKKKKKVVKSTKRNVLMIHTGPKVFPLNRMLAIFCAIVEEKVDLNANLLAQIPTMCQLGLICPVGDNLDDRKFKCTASLEFITVIAKTVGFNVRNYLHDFMH